MGGGNTKIPFDVLLIVFQYYKADMPVVIITRKMSS